MLFTEGQHILFAGDSITDCGRARPVGRGKRGELGEGYVALVANRLTARYPELRLKVTNMGIGGNTSLDLLGRFEEDVLAQKPDIVPIMIGINDIWRWFDTPSEPGRGQTLEQYKVNLGEMLRQLKEAGIQPILITPYFLEADRRDAMRQTCDAFAQHCREVAASEGLPLVDLQARFDEYMSKASSYMISDDRVHPNPVGHTVIADLLMELFEG